MSTPCTADRDMIYFLYIMGMGTIHNRNYTIPDPKHPGEYITITLGREIRGTISKPDPENPGEFIGDKIFRVRRGNGFYDAVLGLFYQDQYAYFVPISINNPEGEPMRRMYTAAWHKWKYDLTNSEKKAYNKRAHKGLRMSGYNLFMREAMKGLVEMYVDRGDPASYDYAKTDLTIDGAWHDLDLKAIVPAGAKAVLIVGHVEGNAVDWTIKFRKKGNTNEVNHGGMETLRAQVERCRMMICSIDANRVLEYNADNQAWTTLDLAVRGWWT